MSNYKILIGDCRETLKTLPAQSVNTCVTSPPYFGLRDYGHEGQMGAEPTPDEFVAALVEVFREVRRVLRDDGTVWLNLGDSYARAGGWSNNNGLDGVSREDSKRAKSNLSYTDGKSQKLAKGLKPKDLIGIPWRVAFALQADGWYLRQDIIWAKPNPMPEGVTDRCTKSHEYIFMLSKSPKYYYDHEAVKEPLADSSIARLAQHNIANQEGSTRANGGAKTNGTMKAVGGTDGKRNRRSVWTVPTKPYKGAHFATFPPALIEPCILAGCPEGGTVLDPFGGSGTTAGVAVSNGRNAVICELNPEYVDLIAERVATVSGAAIDQIVAKKQIDIFSEAL